jgi:hypothetical protein
MGCEKFVSARIRKRGLLGHLETQRRTARAATYRAADMRVNLYGRWLLKVEKICQRQMSKARLTEIGSEVVGTRRNLAVDSIFV